MVSGFFAINYITCYLSVIIKRKKRWQIIFAKNKILETMKILKSYNVQIWVGLKETYNDEKIHDLDDVRLICDEWVNEIKDCITITPTEFRYVDGFEKGVIVGYINYPRFPRVEEGIKARAIKLGEKLMIGLNQYRVTITTPYESIMLENENVNR